MLAIYWGLKRFEYELRGRKFKLETDHKALLEIRKKPQFNNNRINRWIELIQEFDFSVVYVEGEKMGQADQLSRLDDEDKKKWQKGFKISGRKKNKHQTEEEGKLIWTFDSGEKREILRENEREGRIKEVHIDLLHSGVEYVYQKIKKKHYWPNIKKQIEAVINKCEICKKFNRKKGNKGEFVTSSRPFEKVALDLIDMRREGIYISVALLFQQINCNKVHKG
ncbi:putative LTR retrotransposon [Pseudoloma neurophilia]|uniref:Putative LTR retrotransposon n=1 Tax=Pseudoloma neurophilia TaxID=146866 RepID=A0A0R0M169_9MICR|nr:transposable element [Pseudoloma neurophilia]KRH92496.1 putative LTR retrotransposon [Pseudoloma neurophilia]